MTPCLFTNVYVKRMENDRIRAALLQGVKSQERL